MQFPAFQLEDELLLQGGRDVMQGRTNGRRKKDQGGVQAQDQLEIFQRFVFLAWEISLLRDLLGKFVQVWRHISQVIGIRKLGFRLYLSVSRRPASLVRRRATTAPPRRRGPGPRPATSFKYNLRRNPSSNSIVRDITCHCTYCQKFRQFRAQFNSKIKCINYQYFYDFKE